MKPPRPEYPRPMFVREDWINLNGQWDFDFDDHDIGLQQHWHIDHKFRKKITVPFAFQSELSGIGDTSPHNVVWYRRKFDIPEVYRGKRILLHFGAVDYLATVWLNGEPLARHRGGYAPFSCDITDLARTKSNELVLRVEDPQSPHQPRGKQSITPESHTGHYTRCTGIWQSVWLEPVWPHYIRNVHFTPDPDKNAVDIKLNVSGRRDNTQLRTAVSFDGKLQGEVLFPVSSDVVPFSVGLRNRKLWSPEKPYLYDVMFELIEDGSVVDRASAYFGLRKIETDGRKVKLNGKKLVQHLVLNQGYWPEGVYTAPDDASFKRDVELAKELGFNGVRMHEKVADPRYLYWADRLGLLVWEEMASFFEFDDTAVANFAHEWPKVIRRDYNHPSIIAWVPFNESWGIPGLQEQERQREFAGEIVAMTRSLDPTRLIVDNSGWEHLDTDIVDVHNYTQDPEDFLSPPYKPLKPEDIVVAGHAAMTDDVPCEGQPVIVSEYGGIRTESTLPNAYGYGKPARSKRELTRRYRELTEAIRKNKSLAGSCYTQLYDVEQEVNGLLTSDRRPKVKTATIAEINTGAKASSKKKKKKKKKK